eukprot:7396348-Alexandrium_andersonii.AAC.1
MSVQAIALCNDPVKTSCASHLIDGAFLHPKLHDIADVERHPPGHLGLASPPRQLRGRPPRCAP